MADFSKYSEPVPEWLELLEKNPQAAKHGYDVKLFPDDPIKLRDESNKQRDAMSTKMFHFLGLDKVVRYTDHLIPTRDGQIIYLRAYRPINLPLEEVTPALLYYHGGGMLIGSLDSELPLASLLTHSLNMTVLHVCYRHTPEYKHPTQHNDSWDGFEWILAHGKELGIDPTQISLGGVSAGATLAASVTLAETCLALKENRPQRINGQVLIAPWLVTHDQFPFDLLQNRERSSIVQNALEPTLPKVRLDLFTGLYAATDPKDSFNNFLFANDEVLAALPRTAIVVHGKDILRDEGLLYAQILERLG
ncbi:hypothetical protein EsH8_VII_001108 [Colletotrichum jinshuiense]